jgi:hypothetical protein
MVVIGIDIQGAHIIHMRNVATGKKAKQDHQENPGFSDHKPG